MKHSQDRTLKQIEKIQKKIEKANFPDSWWLELLHRGGGWYIQARWTIREPQSRKQRGVVWLGDARLTLMAFAPYYPELPNRVREQLNAWSVKFSQQLHSTEETENP